jgi:hypothetical protein
VAGDRVANDVTLAELPVDRPIPIAESREMVVWVIPTTTLTLAAPVAAITQMTGAAACVWDDKRHGASCWLAGGWRRGRSQYGLLHFGQTFGGLVSRGIHLCGHRSHCHPQTVILTLAMN